ncbi:MAG: SGNH/GDSL hydrolase family protein, partial [Phycisphaerae bacterium]|nr:SGNH/GDSL hydrolase family protein [Phycisphaerae bacterium]
MKILFQGDSITDAGRDVRVVRTANNPSGLGHGYVIMAAARLLSQYPTRDLKFYNRGISGHKVFQLARRWKKDCLDIAPDVLSILIGVNDFWHTFDGGYTGSLDTYEQDYRALIDQTREALPEIRLILCEPFMLPAGEVDPSMMQQFAYYREAARRVAAYAGAVFVPFQSVLDQACQTAPPALWAPDGVHPTLGACHLLANAWVDTVSQAGIPGPV